MNLLEAFRRNTLAEKLLAANVADDVNHDAAQRRSYRRHDHIPEEAGAVLVDIPGHHHIHGQPDKTAIESGHHQNAPYPERLQQRPQKGGIASEDVFDGLQNED